MYGPRHRINGLTITRQYPVSTEKYFLSTAFTNHTIAIRRLDADGWEVRTFASGLRSTPPDRVVASPSIGDGDDGADLPVSAGGSHYCESGTAADVFDIDVEAHGLSGRAGTEVDRVHHRGLESWCAPGNGLAGSTIRRVERYPAVKASAGIDDGVDDVEFKAGTRVPKAKTLGQSFPCGVALRPAGSSRGRGAAVLN